jgi:hypothetical protein
MAEASGISAHAEERDFDRSHVGTVDWVEVDRLNLTRKDSADGKLAMSTRPSVERADEHVHLAAFASAA